MKVDNIEATLRNEDGEHVRVVVDLFYREVLIHRPGIEPAISKAIDASVIQAMAFDVSVSTFEAKKIMLFVWSLMDLEGKNIMEAGIPSIDFGE